MREHGSSPAHAPFTLDAEELHRQWQLSQVFSEGLGNAVETAQVELSDLQTVLDVACGVGSWSLELAQAAPSVQVIGIDHRPACVAFAQQMAQQHSLSNARFLVQNPSALETTAAPFAPGSVDLVHLAFQAPALLTITYPALLRTLFGLTRAGGTLLWTEMELPITTSPACERFTSLICQALQAAGQSFVPPIFQELAQLFEQLYEHSPAERRHLGITMMMSSWLRECGYQQVECLAHAIEVSADTGAHPAFMRQIEVGLRQIRPFLLAQGVLDEETYARLSSQLLAEVQQPDFCGLCYLLTVRGQTPC